jgi:hypothetical protein
VRSTGDLERQAADALGPVFDRTLKNLDLGPDKARVLMRHIAEAYMTGRAEAVNVFPPKANLALSAEGVAIALALQRRPTIGASCGSTGTTAGGASDRAGIETSEQEAPEVMARGSAHTVAIEVAVDWDDPERLIELLAALDARTEPLGLPVGAHVRRRVIGVTLTVEAGSRKAAEELATRVLIDEIGMLGLV